MTWRLFYIGGSKENDSGQSNRWSERFKPLSAQSFKHFDLSVNACCCSETTHSFSADYSIKNTGIWNQVAVRVTVSPWTHNLIGHALGGLRNAGYSTRYWSSLDSNWASSWFCMAVGQAHRPRPGLTLTVQCTANFIPFPALNRVSGFHANL